MRVRMVDLVVREREVELPDECPGCGAKLDTDESVAEVGLDWNYGDGVALPVSEDFPRGDRTLAAMGHCCQDCGHLLAWGKLAVFEAPDQTERDRTLWSIGVDRLYRKRGVTPEA